MINGSKIHHFPMLPQAFQLIYGINSDECRIKTGEKINL
ncbi:hypothetical protein M089_2741 [Bacteroides ovatus str. 3725 D9 iii]|uniref:Uncharacterized protein n=1 Tax=Bacteroides ovatus (strain ATCC 8483 / DSM 1896 / JCM 5824 / BCRC 10623 / CCUG 4943 / NCTC 11153) TaxID=411476 RepID=A0AAN3A282_BACO1|nr:hypothetical protein BACOVA_04912 [Bacteroides ovatus ATCC 8483]EEO58555.1 hypothetical protein BSCG_05484 [Bacteroides sp. 2_2_4]KDS21782.1 hypothetical protein M082_0710 [Bacteroides fragilis str. 3725 D9 ii]KDS23522.1 hypothetical protein M088_5540 [Bacteroides ovatus str. 3725 D1 iv]KDS40395.1 hypothetical protein M089_2741 [Bacteroides ovatus str. 3725 D9 iii]CAG9866667.1 FIG00409296: hypothetical protein [Bacteroides ovatus]